MLLLAPHRPPNDDRPRHLRRRGGQARTFAATDSGLRPFHSRTGQAHAARAAGSSTVVAQTRRLHA